MDDLRELNILILKAQKDNNELLNLYKMFLPLIKKYTYMLNYAEGESDLLIFFITLIRKFPNSLLVKDSNPYILSYINKSMLNEYIRLSKKNKLLQDESYELNLDIIFEDNDNIETFLLLREIFQIIPYKAKKVLYLKFFYGYSDEEIGEYFNVSRQAINKYYRKIVNNIKLHFSN